MINLPPSVVATADERFVELIVKKLLLHLEPQLARKQRRLVDRPSMAELASISIPLLDRLVSDKRVPSVLVGKRRLFDPEAVIDALTSYHSTS